MKPPGWVEYCQCMLICCLCNSVTQCESMHIHIPIDLLPITLLLISHERPDLVFLVFEVGMVEDLEKVSLLSVASVCACIPSKPSCVLRSRTGRVLKRGPAPLQILVVAVYPSVLRDTRRTAPYPNRGTSLPPVRCQLKPPRVAPCITHRPAGQCWCSQLFEDTI